MPLRAGDRRQQADRQRNPRELFQQWVQMRIVAELAVRRLAEHLLGVGRFQGDNLDRLPPGVPRRVLEPPERGREGQAGEVREGGHEVLDVLGVGLPGGLGVVEDQGRGGLGERGQEQALQVLAVHRHAHGECDRSDEVIPRLLALAVDEVPAVAEPGLDLRVAQGDARDRGLAEPHRADDWRRCGLRRQQRLDQLVDLRPRADEGRRGRERGFRRGPVRRGQRVEERGEVVVLGPVSDGDEERIAGVLGVHPGHLVVGPEPVVGVRRAGVDRAGLVEQELEVRVVDRVAAADEQQDLGRHQASQRRLGGSVIFDT